MVNEDIKEVLIGRDVFNRDVGINLEEDPIIVLNHFNSPYKNKVIYSIIVQVMGLTKLPLTIIGDVDKKLGYYLSRIGNKIDIVRNEDNIKEEIEPKVYYIVGDGKEIPKRKTKYVLNKNNIVILDVNEYKEGVLKEEISIKKHTFIQMHTEDTTMGDIIREYKIPLPKLHKTTDAYIKRTGDVLPQRVQLYNIIKNRDTTKRNYEFYPQPLGAFTKLLLETDKESKLNKY